MITDSVTLSAEHFGEKRTLHAISNAPIFVFHHKLAMRMHCRNCEEFLRCKIVQHKACAAMISFTAGEHME